MRTIGYFLGIISSLLLVSAAAAEENWCTVEKTAFTKNRSEAAVVMDSSKPVAGLWEGGNWNTTSLCTAIAIHPNGKLVYATSDNPKGRSAHTVPHQATSMDERQVVSNPYNNGPLTLVLSEDGKQLFATMVIGGLGTYKTVYTRVPDGRLAQITEK